MKNSLLSDSNEPFGTIPFNDIQVEHFIPALDIAIKKGVPADRILIENKSDLTWSDGFRMVTLPFIIS